MPKPFGRHHVASLVPPLWTPKVGSAWFCLHSGVFPSPMPTRPAREKSNVVSSVVKEGGLQRPELWPYWPWEDSYIGRKLKCAFRTESLPKSSESKNVNICVKCQIQCKSEELIETSFKTSVSITFLFADFYHSDWSVATPPFMGFGECGRSAGHKVRRPRSCFSPLHSLIKPWTQRGKASMTSTSCPHKERGELTTPVAIFI